MIQFYIFGDSEEIIKKLFSRSNKSNQLNFGISGISTGGCEIENLFQESVEFNDYLMEGSIKYKLKINKIEQGLSIKLFEMGSSRDKYLHSHLRHIFRSAGYDFELASSNE